jgi:hypothetical protein
MDKNSDLDVTVIQAIKLRTYSLKSSSSLRVVDIIKDESLAVKRLTSNSIFAITETFDSMQVVITLHGHMHGTLGCYVSLDIEMHIPPREQRCNANNREI